jgi:hypothetical protein
MIARRVRAGADVFSHTGIKNRELTRVRGFAYRFDIRIVFS